MCWLAGVSVSEIACGPPAAQKHGHRHETQCSEPFVYGRRCQFECDSGYELPPNSIALLNCDVVTVSGSERVQWDNDPTDCEGSTRNTHVTHSTLLDRLRACAYSYENLPKYRSYRISNTAPRALASSYFTW